MGTPTRPIHFFSIDNELLYWNFFLDYGPLNLGQLYKFCHILNKKVSTSTTASSSSNKKNNNYDNKIICYYSNSTNNKRANALFLICAWQVLYLNCTPEESMHQYFKHQNKKNTTTFLPLEPFHDASPCICTYDLNIIDCLYGLAKAKKYNFFSFINFNVNEYEYYEQVENGDLNWIVQDKILAFAGPHNTRNIAKNGGYCTLTPNEYIPYFKKKNIDLVVRLNKKNYDEQKFMTVGINFKEHYYLDGSIPTKKILLDVINSFETCSKKAFAVHCKAGLGRTGTCIGAYIMKHFKFTASEVIGWMRICRPGCVIGPQQHYLEELQDFMWHEGDIMRLKLGKNQFITSQLQQNQQQELQKHNNKNSINKPKEKKKSLSSKHSKKRISTDGTTTTTNTTTTTSSSTSTSNKVLSSITKQLQFGSLSVSSNNNSGTKQPSTQGDVLLFRRQQQQHQHMRS